MLVVISKRSFTVNGLLSLLTCSTVASLLLLVNLLKNDMTPDSAFSAVFLVLSIKPVLTSLTLLTSSEPNILLENASPFLAI